MLSRKMIAVGVPATLNNLSNMNQIMQAIVFLRMLVTMSLLFYNAMSYLAHDQAACELLGSWMSNKQVQAAHIAIIDVVESKAIVVIT